MKHRSLCFAVFTLVVTAMACSAEAQIVNTTVQLPTVRRFSVNTVVSVPDGGTLVIGGGSASSSSSRRRGLSRGTAGSASPAGISIRPSLIIQSELDAKLTGRGRRILAAKARPDIHGTVRERAKASFLAKNLGRGLR